jgi:nitrogen regulatory protein P-II 1
LELVVKDVDLERAVRTIISVAKTGEIGDGKIYILPVEEVIRVRTEERGDIAV